MRTVVAVVSLSGVLGATTGAGALARRHHRNHRAGAPATSHTGGPITIVPNVIKLTGTGAFSASINGNGLPIAMPLAINTATLDAACSSSVRIPKVFSPSAGAALPATTKVGTDGRFVGSLVGLGCQPGAYAVAVHEQAFPYDTFYAVVTLTL